MKYLLVDVCIHKHITCYYYASCINTIQLKLNEQFKHKLIVVSNAKSIIIHAIKLQHILCSCISNLTNHIFYLSNFMQKMHIKQVGELYQHKLYNYDQMVLSISLLSFFSSLSSLLPLFRVCPGAAGAAQGRSLKTLHKYELKAGYGYQFIPVESIKILSTEFLCRVKSKSLKVCRKDI